MPYRLANAGKLRCGGYEIGTFLPFGAACIQRPGVKGKIVDGLKRLYTFD